jgi:hypothetical protein
MKSRWAYWSKGTEEKKSFSSLFEGNPTGTGIQSPGEKAAAMGLVSDGHGGYRDKESGQLVARTVNGELVFYDPGPTGGVVADGNGGAYVTQAQPSWRDPRTGMAMTPPMKPESPAEVAAVPYATPATAPMGFHAFMQKKKQQAYDMQNPEPMRKAADDMGGEGDIQVSEASEPNPKIKGQPDLNTLVKNIQSEPSPQKGLSMRQFVSKNSGNVNPKPQPQVQQKPLQQTQPTPGIDMTNDNQDEIDYDETKDNIQSHINSYNDMVSQYRAGLGELTSRQNANADKRYGRMRELLQNIDDPNKRNNFLNGMALAHSYTGRINSGAGKNALGQVDHELLTKNEKRLREGYNKGDVESIKKLVESTRIMDVSDDEVEAFFDILPPGIQKNFMGAGKISDKYTDHYLGVDADGNEMRGALSGKQSNGMSNGRLRGLLVAKLLLQQGMKDGYTGADLDLNQTDLEHVLGFRNNDNGDPTDDDFRLRENINNFLLTGSNKNQTKVDKGMDAWYEDEVHKLDDFTDEDYQNRSELFSEANSINDVGSTLGQLFLNDDGTLRDDASSENFESYARRDRELTKNINSRINKFAKEKGVNLSKVKGRLGYELIKRMGLGAYMTKKSGRGNQAKLDDKIYTAFVSTMMDANPEDRGKLAEMWKTARKLGSDAAKEENNDGAAKRTLVSHLLQNGGISKKFLDDKEFKRILKEDLDIDVII